MPGDWEFIPGWCTGADEILTALRTLYSYTDREPDRATGWLYAARQIGTLPATPWPSAMTAHGDRLLSEFAATRGVRFDAACFQAYLNGSGCGWHYDRDWDAQAIISLGVTRSFGLRRKFGLLDGDDGEFFLQVSHGDMLFMPPGFQEEWEHCVLTEESAGERCSLVFRSEARPQAPPG